jgi:DNA-binding response OmpR family regulator
MTQLLFLPLTWNELIAQVRREMGRSSSAKESNVVQFGQVRIDLLAMEVRRCDRPVSLTAMEFKVLRFFVSNPNRVISRDELLNQVWGYANYPCTRTVDNHVLRLRQKLEAEMAHPVHFRTVHGIGYKFIP